MTENRPTWKADCIAIGVFYCFLSNTFSTASRITHEVFLDTSEFTEESAFLFIADFFPLRAELIGG
jgi:hypothetical protein